MTGITADDIPTGRPFPEALAVLTDELAPSGGMCCTWGNDDALIPSTCQAHRMKSPLRYLVDVGAIVREFVSSETPCEPGEKRSRSSTWV
jgi:hypothetical protein